jgi:hypothetical protein
VRRTEREAGKFSGKALALKAARAGAEATTQGMQKDWGRLELERQLGEYMGTKVRVQGPDSAGKGQIVIEFYHLDHFDGLMTKMGFVMR